MSVLALTQQQASPTANRISFKSLHCFKPD